MYFSEELPNSKIRTQGKFINRCIVRHVFKASKKEKASIIQKDKGCPSGLFWTWFSKKIIYEWAYFISYGRYDVLGSGAESLKKTKKLQQ